ncbi:MAG: SH3 domain-containing protein [Clostridia bacterium]
MNKRAWSFFFAVVLLATMAFPFSALALDMDDMYVYTSNGKPLNLRSAPITHADNRVASIPYGAEVSIYEFVNKGTWAYVNYRGDMGYVMSRYLVAHKPNAKPTPKPAAPTTDAGVVSFKNFAQVSYYALVRPSAPGGYVNLRWAPSKSMAVYDKMYDGQKLEVIAQNATWAQVRNVDTEAVGFIMRSFLTEMGDGAK